MTDSEREKIIERLDKFLTWQEKKMKSEEYAAKYFDYQCQQMKKEYEAMIEAEKEFRSKNTFWKRFFSL